MAIWAVGLSSKMGSDKIEETIFNMRAVAEDLCKALDKSFGY